MRRILPSPSPGPDQGHDLDLHDLVAGEHRNPPAGRPWVMINMITSLDGRVTDAEGRSGGLGGPGDRALFRALRGRADIILAGAGTVRVENYGPPRLPSAVREARVAAGRPPLPRLAVASAGLDLPAGLRMFETTPATAPPLVLTGEGNVRAHRARADALASRATILTAGDPHLDWHQALAALARDHGATTLLVEGGPTVNHQLFAADLVDELRMTLAPVLDGGLGPGLADGGIRFAHRRRFHLAGALEDDDYLLLRYLRTYPGDPPEKSSETAS